MTKPTQIVSHAGPRTRFLRAARFEARIAQAQQDMFDRAEAYIDGMLAAAHDPEALETMIEAIAASQYGGSEGGVAARSRLAARACVAQPDNRDLRRQLLGYMVSEIITPSFPIKNKLGGATDKTGHHVDGTPCPCPSATLG